MKAWVSRSGISLLHQGRSDRDCRLMLADRVLVEIIVEPVDPSTRSKATPHWLETSSRHGDCPSRSNDLNMANIAEHDLYRAENWYWRSVKVRPEEKATRIRAMVLCNYRLQTSAPSTASAPSFDSPPARADRSNT